VKGVGRLMMIAIEWEGGRNQTLRLEFAVNMAVIRSRSSSLTVSASYVSCSVPRLPIARLAAAHAKLKEKEKKPLESYGPDSTFSVFF